MDKRHKIPDSKYSFQMDEKGAVKFFRYDEDLTDLIGNNLAFDMAYMIESLLKENEQLKKVIKGVSIPKETVRFNLEKLYKSKNVNSGYIVKLTEDVSLLVLNANLVNSSSEAEPWSFCFNDYFSNLLCRNTWYS